MLKRYTRVNGFLETPALEAVGRDLAHDAPPSLIGAVFNMTAQLQADVQAQTMVGRQLGSYQLLSLLGAGAMGEVYRAKDSRLDREVAVRSSPAISPRTRVHWSASSARPRRSRRSHIPTFWRSMILARSKAVASR